ncbi:MAG: hypothetical protein DMG10_03530 [Acidobacteria bacterium]|nr:MAG: hypothetical protein DMG10_03530 [Acidobacteriota bacterium]
MPELDVVVCGLVVADIIGRPIDVTCPPARGGLRLINQIQLFTGGNVCNVGIALAKLGARVGAISRVGDDRWKDFVLAELHRYGIDTRGIRVERGAQTSATIVCVDESGERSFFSVLDSTNRITSADLLDNLPLLRRSRMLALGYYGLLPSLETNLPGILAALKRKTRSAKRPGGIEIALDTGGSAIHGGRLPRLGQCLRFVDYFIPSHDEARALTGVEDPREILDAIEQAAEVVPKVIGVKLGDRGCLLRERAAAQESASPLCPGEHLIPAFRVRNVVDTTGAGDCFYAGFLAALLRGYSAAEAGRFANRVAGCCIEKLGATSGVRSFQATRKML